MELEPSRYQFQIHDSTDISVSIFVIDCTDKKYVLRSILLNHAIIIVQMNYNQGFNFKTMSLSKPKKLNLMLGDDFSSYVWNYSLVEIHRRL